MMKKKLIALLMVVAAAASLTACGEPFTCDICGEEKTGKSYTETVMGAEITYCRDCHDELEELSKELDGLTK